MNTPINVTPKQRACLRFIHNYVDTYGIVPSFDEIRIGIHLKSKSGVSRLLHALEDRGHIKFSGKYLARSYELCYDTKPVPIYPDWQPIETAPKDGTLVLLYWPNGFVPDGNYEYNDWPDPINVCVGKWLSGYRGGNWVVPLIDAYFGVPSDPSCDLDFIEVAPTHWASAEPPK